MGGSAHASFAVGGVVISGGLYAYLVKKSWQSLYSSAVLGAGLLYGGYMIMHGDDLNGHIMSAIASSGILATGVKRYWQTRVPMPALPIAAVGLISSIYQFKKVNDWSR